MNEVFRIVSGALRLDIDKVRNYTSFLAEKLEAGGDKSSAERLRKLLSESDHRLRPAGVGAARALPVDSESRFPLVERADTRGSKEPRPILSDEQWQQVNEFLSVARSQTEVESQGLPSVTTMLLYGPPGCGKSHLARHVARELGLDLYVARLDGLISSFLGSTAKNIRALFEFASRTPCVLFLDEFDAIAKLRGDAQELGELKRVVNSFLQTLDTIGRQSIVLAATNHDELLDRAVWRRFAYRLELGYPGAEQRTALWAQFLSPLKVGRKHQRALVDVSEGFSGSDIAEACLRLHRQRLTRKESTILAQAVSALVSLSSGEGSTARFLAAHRTKDVGAFAAALRARNSKLYSHAVIGELLGVSKATAYRLTVAKERGDG